MSDWCPFLRSVITSGLLLLASFVSAEMPGLDADGPRTIPLPPVRVDAEVGLKRRFAPIIDSVERLGAGPVPYVVSIRIAPPADDASSSQRDGAFRLTVDAQAAILRADDAEGVVNGLTTFETLASKGILTLGVVEEKPVHRIRALHFVMRGLTFSDLTRLVFSARAARFNLLIVQIADAVRFKTLTEHVRPDALDSEEFARFVSFARANGLDVVPEIKLLTHQEKFLKHLMPDSMFNAVTYDPESPAVQEVVFRYLDEVIDLIKPTAVHIGHDEVRQIDSVGIPNGLKRGEAPLPASLYQSSIESLRSFLKERQTETWMWGDMFLSQSDVPQMDHRTLHGTPEYRDVLDALPRDVVICDWRYYDTSEFQSSKLFSDLGFRVLGATWKRPAGIRGFSRYMVGVPNAQGMIATTWFELQRGNWDTIEGIIAESGRAFWYGD